MQLAWERVESSVQLSPRDTTRPATGHIELHVVCKRLDELLNVVTTTLGEAGVHIFRVATFCARSNTILINTFEVSDNFDEEIAQQIKQRVVTLIEAPNWFLPQQLLSGMLRRPYPERMLLRGARLSNETPECSSWKALEA